MADEASETPGPFDVKTIRLLVALMSRNDLSEIDLRNGEQRIRLRRGPQQTVLPPALFPSVAAAPLVPTAPQSASGATPSADAAKTAAKATIPIKSPTPGTFYAASKPGAPPFVQVGTRVTPTTVVCMIEAMKLFNEITADCTGVITEILVENQQPVEYGQVLFNVDPTG
ncbi:MAG TPA: acetyl-CoA carboxylase biotin carboxyl carrier protein [Gemmataceae bacterium]